MPSTLVRPTCPQLGDAYAVALPAVRRHLGGPRRVEVLQSRLAVVVVDVDQLRLVWVLTAAERKYASCALLSRLSLAVQ